MRKSLFVVALSVCFSLGCESEDDGVFTRTIVTLRGTDAPAVRTESFRRPEARAGVLEQAIAEDPSCLGSSIWIYNRTYRAGDEICFSGAGYAYLGDYYYCHLGRCSYWYDSGISKNRVLSYWAGNEGGDFTSAASDFGYPFNATDPPVYDTSSFPADFRSMPLLHLR
jgi:hypothetical protein